MQARGGNDRKPSLLLVDDEETVVRALRRILREAGYGEVFTAESPEDAIAILASRTIDVAIVDLQMGGGPCGLDVLREIKERWPVTDVLIMTGHPEPDWLVGCNAGRADAILLKPIRPDAFRRQVREAIERAAHRRRRLHEMWSLRPAIAAPDRPVDVIEAGGLRVDLPRTSADWRGRPLSLGPALIRLLACLARRPGRTVPTPRIRGMLWPGAQPEASHRHNDLLRAHVFRLRRALREIGQDAPTIAVTRGVGYRLVLAKSRSAPEEG